MLTPGIHRDIPEDVYHKRELGVVSNSALKEFRRTAAHYRAWLAGIEKEPSPAKQFGKALHMAALEPEKYAAKYTTLPDFGAMQSPKNREKRDAWLNERPGISVISAADADKVTSMVTVIRADPILSTLLSDPGGMAEVTMVWIDPQTGLTCKIRVDWWAPTYGRMLDLKTTEEASEYEFARSMANYGYHRQSALYLEGGKALGLDVGLFVFAAVEKDAPFLPACYWNTETDLEKGRNANRAAIDGLSMCLKTNHWPGYTGGELPLPAWAA
jgi:hypothetical protein